LEDVFPYDFFSHFFNYREYFGLLTAHLKTGKAVTPDLIRLIRASLHHYLGYYEGDCPTWQRPFASTPPSRVTR